MKKGKPPQACMLESEREETGEPSATDIVGEVLIHRLTASM